MLTVLSLKQIVKGPDFAARILDISRKVLNEQQKELELDGFVLPEQFKEILQRVEYSFTKNRKSLSPVLNKMGINISSQSVKWILINLIIARMITKNRLYSKYLFFDQP